MILLWHKVKYGLLQVFVCTRYTGEDYQADHPVIDRLAWSGSYWLHTGYTHCLCILLTVICDASRVNELDLEASMKSVKLLYV